MDGWIDGYIYMCVCVCVYTYTVVLRGVVAREDLLHLKPGKGKGGGFKMYR